MNKEAHQYLPEMTCEMLYYAVRYDTLEWFLDYSEKRTPFPGGVIRCIGMLRIID
jgi:hypothetical protein